MNTLAFLVGVLLSLATVNCRSFDDSREADLMSEVENENYKTHVAGRHRRRRHGWQMHYEYDHPMPPYYPERREYDNNHQDLLPKIVRLLEEISVNVKKPQPPPPPPQPIYIPYPVAYPALQCTPCAATGEKKPNNVSLSLENRFGGMEDSNQNWGITSEDDTDDDSLESDGVRPISFEPIKPPRPMRRPAPRVDHGSVQSDVQSQSTEAPMFVAEVDQSEMSVMCNAAVLSCCIDASAQQRQCFNNFGCGDFYNNGKACNEDAINAAIAVIRSKYGVKE